MVIAIESYPKVWKYVNKKDYLVVIILPMILLKV